MMRFHFFLDNIKESVPVYLLKLNGHLDRSSLMQAPVDDHAELVIDSLRHWKPVGSNGEVVSITAGARFVSRLEAAENQPSIQISQRQTRQRLHQ